MPTSNAYRPLDSSARTTITRAHAWRPFPREVADILCIDEPAAAMRPRMHGRLSVTLIASPTIIRVESGRSIVADSGSLLLVPAWQLYALRDAHARDEAGNVAVTLLAGERELDGLRVADRPAIVIDAELGAQAAALVAQLRQPVRSIECARTLHSLIEGVVSRGTPVAAARSPQTTAPLAPVRAYLHAHLGDQVTTAMLARIGGLTEWHLIRAFHREFGLPPHAYHLRLRLAAASELLVAGLSVSTAAYECGFADQSHLSRKFKEVHGLTPAAWATAVGDRRSGEQQFRSIPTAVARGMLGRHDAPPVTRRRGPLAEIPTHAARAAGSIQ
ncbi:MAG TPA: AraC family transcriptional regulator [Gemmatimonadaceae bacterium]|nr:AraC family transcriptional regulator [Gemmatimonadaceae bacterium]